MEENYKKEILKEIREKSDKLMNFFLVAFFSAGLLLAFYYDTWLIAIGVGGLSLLAYYSSKLLLPQSNLYQYVLAVVLGIFVAQFIYQMHGMFEMHFLAFISSAILITYRNWKLQLPLAIVVILHHAAFGYLQFIGMDKVYFTQQGDITLLVFAIHILLATAIFSICGLWAYNFKKSGEKQTKQSFEIGKLQEASLKKDILLSMSKNLKLTNEKLKEANCELKKIFDTIEEVLFSMDTINYNFIQVSVGCIKVYGYTPEDFFLDNDLWKKVIHPLDNYIIEDIAKQLRQGKPVSNQYRIIHRDTTVRWIETKIIPTINNAGKVTRVDGVCNDITEKIKLETKLTAEKIKNQQQITAAVITAQEKERYFLGQELHDNINPILATAKLYMDCAINREDNRADLIKNSKDFINTAMNEIRTLSKTLVPPSLGEIGLTEALTEMVDDIKRVNETNFITNWQFTNESLLSDSLKLTIYRIVQEQVNNIFKHAKAQSVFIGLQQKGRLLCLTVKDDGVGFNAGEKRKGLGLQNIISRAALFAGRVIINTTPGKGCELLVHFNVKEAAASNVQKAVRA